jgi:hypothetical protein
MHAKYTYRPNYTTLTIVSQVCNWKNKKNISFIHQAKTHHSIKALNSCDRKVEASTRTSIPCILDL